jgi:hypothetical protein
MLRATLFLCAATTVLALAGTAHADYHVIRWSSGECTIWNNDTNQMPYGEGWIVLAWALPDYESARWALGAEIAKGQCRV